MMEYFFLLELYNNQANNLSSWKKGNLVDYVLISGRLNLAIALDAKYCHISLPDSEIDG
jgi:predicted AAA+ superfamily ATPase